MRPSPSATSSAALAGARVRVPADFDFAWVLTFLRPRAITGIEWVGGGAYGRSLDVHGSVHMLRLMASGRHVHADAEPAVPAAYTRTLMRRMLDLDTDLAQFHAQVSGDAVLGPLVARQPGIRLIRFPDAFEGLVRAILGQQVSLAAASTAAARLARLLGKRIATPCAGITYAFPTPAALADADERSIRDTGLTGAKAHALATAARAVANRELDLAELAASSPERADAALRSLPGIGPWTAAYVRMRGFGHRDAFPASDLGVLKALRWRLGQPTLSAKDAERIAEAWRPWRAYATLHLWHSLADPAWRSRPPFPGRTNTHPSGPALAPQRRGSTKRAHD